jgi:alpha-acetolactate decarboxylase
MVIIKEYKKLTILDKERFRANENKAASNFSTVQYVTLIFFNAKTSSRIPALKEKNSDMMQLSKIKI